MARTFNKGLKSIVVKTIGGETINASDTATAPIASDALRDFEGFGIMHIKGEDNLTLVPFHAVDNIVVTSAQSEVSRPDPYGCEDESSETENEPSETVEP